MTIPSSVTSIENYAFYGCELDYLIIKGPLSSYNIFGKLSCQAVVVPENQMDAARRYWQGTLYSFSSLYLFTEIRSYPTAITFKIIGNPAMETFCKMQKVEFGGNLLTPDADGLYVAKDLHPNTSYTSKVYYEMDGNEETMTQEKVVSTSDIAKVSTEVTQASITLRVTLNDDPYNSATSEYGVYFNRYYYQADKDGYVTIGNLQTNTTYSFSPYMKLSDGTTYTGKAFDAKTASMNPRLTLISSSPTTVVLQGSYSKGDAVNAIGFTGYESDGTNLALTGLTPGYTYTFTYFAKTKYGDQETYSLNVKLPAIEWETLPAKATSNTVALICANTNIDEAETNTGFEWRRYDAPDLVPSTQAPCPVVGGTLTGALKNLSAGTYYKFRPYYTSSAGTTYYGEWLAFGTADAYVYFDPTVRTYEATEVGSSSARVKGFAIGGSDDITEQGFEYWKTSGAAISLKRAVAPLAAAEGTQTVLSSGQWMTATLDNLEPGTTYTFRAYVKTASATTYGEEMTFTTDFPTGIGQVETTGEAVEVARFTIDGRRIDTPQKGINLIRMSDGTTRKVYVK